jgi:hypothetical protein
VVVPGSRFDWAYGSARLGAADRFKTDEKLVSEIVYYSSGHFTMLYLLKDLLNKRPCLLLHQDCEPGAQDEEPLRRSVDLCATADVEANQLKATAQSRKASRREGDLGVLTTEVGDGVHG